MDAEFASPPGACAGRSILDQMWEHLDATVDRLMTPGAEAADGTDRGRALGLALAIAIVTNPYEPSLPAIRAESMERWESRQDDSELVDDAADDA